MAETDRKGFASSTGDGSVDSAGEDGVGDVLLFHMAGNGVEGWLLIVGVFRGGGFISLSLSLSMTNKTNVKKEKSTLCTNIVDLIGDSDRLYLRSTRFDLPNFSA